VSLLPTDVWRIQSEIENFPYQRLRKAGRITALEAAAHLAAGCTGAAFNVLSMLEEPLDEYVPLVAELHRWRPFYDQLVRNLGRAPLAGIHAAWSKDTAAACDLGGGDWTAYGRFVYHLAPRPFALGLPIAYAPQGGCVTLLCDENVLAFSVAELRAMLASGVYMDAAALTRLNRMGLQQLTGLQLERTVTVDAIERLTDHPLNGPFSGRERDCRQSFNRQPAHVLRATDPGTQVLARLVDYGGAEIGPCTMAVFENRLGGRVCVAGYFPWTFLQSLSKASQVKAVMRWLSRDRLPAYVASLHQVNLWVRAVGHGRVALVLMNSSFDPADALELLILTDQQTIQVLDTACRLTPVAGSAAGPYHRFVLPRIGPWEMRLVTAGAGY
jgi:hypothetical protein